MTRYIMVTTTADSEEQAQTIADTLVEKKLAACVQVLGPVTSTYRWKGNVEHSKEWLCIAKTHDSLFPLLSEAVKEMHSYDVPEIVALPIEDGTREYLSWLLDETRHV